MQKLKKIIPNILTSMRLIVTPFVVYLGIKGYYKELTIICIIVALTDFFDGFLARKWNACTPLGAKLDTIGDKTLAVGLLSILIIKNNIFIYLLVLEGIIVLINMYSYFKTKIVESILIGKLKTWVLFITLTLGLVNVFFPKIHILMNIFIGLSIIFQIMTFILYIRNYYLYKTKKKI